MLEKIQEWDESLFVFLNGYHSDFLDPIVFLLTQTLPWIPLYIILIYLIWKVYGKQSWWVILALAICILLADQFTSGFMKPFFERLRPCHDPKWEGLVHNYDRCGGYFGFASSHAANSFAIATLIVLAVSKRFPVLKWLFLWAGLFSYTRIYLGVHYPGDVVVGAMVGVLAAYLAFYVSKKVFDTVSNKVK